MEISRLFWFIFPALCFSLFTLIPKTQADPNFVWVDCRMQTASNVSRLGNASISYNNFTRRPSSGRSRSKNLVLCRGDISGAVCQDCFTFAFGDAPEQCPKSRRITIWYNECMLRYSDQSIPSVLDLSYGKILINPDNVTDTTGFNHVWGEVMDDIATRASSGGSVLKFAVKESNLSALQKLYGLAQCMPELTNTDCYSCLRTCISAFPTCCNRSSGARVLYPSCNVRYEMYQFYNAAAVPPPPPSTTTSSPGSIGKKIAIGVGVSLFVMVTLLGLGIYFKKRRQRTKKEEKENNQEAQLLELAQGRFDDDYITENLEGERHTKSKEFPSIQLDLILVATKQFSKENKLGEGGFGPVYKGTLPDGKEIAVKRLSKTSGQGLLELKNEVTMIARLQHRNLVRLLGCCLEGNEALLIYEYMPNKSLDVFLFDSTKGAELDWKRRLLVINGIARGLLYLHEDSRLRIIHRDLKASNVLLDHEMNHKLSNFGMANIFCGNQSEANTNRVVGTYGYMAPEYAMEGLFSIKSDVFSFGVLLLEIISGKKNSGFHHSMHGHSLLTFAWKLWSEG